MKLPMIDWLSFTIDIQDYQKVCEELLTLLEIHKTEAQELRAKNSSDKVTIQIGQETFEVLPNGHANYAYILHNKFLEVRFAKYRSRQPESYPIFVHFKSEFLWCVGPENAWDWFCFWTEYHFGKMASNKINRADLCCHCDDISFVSDDIENFKGRYAKSQIYLTERELTGIEFGSRNSGTVFARIYNKSLEVVQTKTKTWFYDIWQKREFNPDKVWNIEFELKREFFKQSGIENVNDFFERLQDLWRYCTVKWLNMIYPNNSRSERCPITMEWLLLQDAFNVFKSTNLISRHHQAQAEKQALVPSAMGYITAYGALCGINDPELAAESLISEGLKFLSNKNTSFGDVVNQKRRLRCLGGLIR